jgi:hypothetical protein
MQFGLSDPQPASAAERYYMRIESSVAKTRARTVEGMMAKVRCVQIYSATTEILNNQLEDGSCGEAMATSIFREVQGLAGEEGSLESGARLKSAIT